MSGQSGSSCTARHHWHMSEHVVRAAVHCMCTANELVLRCLAELLEGRRVHRTGTAFASTLTSHSELAVAGLGRARGLARSFHELQGLQAQDFDVDAYVSKIKRECPRGRLLKAIYASEQS
jgi:hypothetical protein